MPDPNVGRFVWYDLLTSDPSAATAFYTHVVGWKAQPFTSEYTSFASAQGALAGTTAIPEPLRNAGAPPHWTANVQVANADATVKRARELGGKVLVEPSDIPDIGRLGVIADPQGVAVNVYQRDKPMTLHDTSKPGEVVWHELLTTDHEAAFRFYSALFGWVKSSDFDMGAMGKYLLYGLGGKDLGGMFTKAKVMPTPPSWFYYIQVAELESAIERAKAKGGRLLNGPMQVPGGAHIAQLEDPQGAVFALHEEAKRAKANGSS